jgi:hypothetical protein
MEVLNFASPKWVYMFKSVEKWLCKSWNYKTIAGGAILNYSAILKFWKKVTSTIFFMNWCFQIQSLKDLDENWLNFGTFVPGGHLEFLRHFELIFLKIYNVSFLWSRLSKYVIGSTLKLIAHGTVFFLQLSSHYCLEDNPYSRRWRRAELILFTKMYCS